jgi:predicted amidohydrolase
VKVLEDQENRLIMLPTVMDDEIRPEYIRTKLQAAIGSDETILAFSCHSRNGLKHRAVIFTAAGVIGHFYKKHGNMDERLGSTLAPLKTSIGNVAVMFDQEGLVPEVARTFMLQGTEMLLWFDGTGEEDCQENFCRTRASENKIYILYNGSGCSEIVDPAGRILAVSLQDQDQAVSALLLRFEARNKVVVPGTDVVLGRRPELYGMICRK